MPKSPDFIRTSPQAARVQDYERDRRENYPWRKFYKTARWQAIRSHQLSVEPLCRFCSEKGLIKPAAIVDHIKPHRGDEVRFFSGPFQSLCKPCHDGAKQRIERKRALFRCSINP